MGKVYFISKGFMGNFKNLEVEKQIVIMVNVRFHKIKQINDIFNSYGHQILYLLPYSTILNQIEIRFQKFYTERKMWKRKIIINY